jgi:hypothetical protein
MADRRADRQSNLAGKISDGTSSFPADNKKIPRFAKKLGFG